MKKLFILLTAMLPFTAWGQIMNARGNSIHDLVPNEDWTCTQAIGDLNKDGVMDLAFIAFPPQEGELPVLAIFEGQKRGGYVIWKEYTEKLPPNREEYVYRDMMVEITPKGVLKISMNTFMSAGGWGNTDETFLFRYQQGDFFLIGQDSESMARNTGIAESVSINYLTCKKQERKYSVMRDVEMKPTEKWSRIPKKPLVSLSDWSCY